MAYGKRDLKIPHLNKIPALEVKGVALKTSKTGFFYARPMKGLTYGDVTVHSC